MDQILHRKLINEKTNLEFQVAKANKEVAKLMETVQQYEAVLASLDEADTKNHPDIPNNIRLRGDTNENGKPNLPKQSNKPAVAPYKVVKKPSTGNKPIEEATLVRGEEAIKLQAAKSGKRLPTAAEAKKKMEEIKANKELEQAGLGKLKNSRLDEVLDTMLDKKVAAKVATHSLEQIKSEQKMLGNMPAVTPAKMTLLAQQAKNRESILKRLKEESTQLDEIITPAEARGPRRALAIHQAERMERILASHNAQANAANNRAGVITKGFADKQYDRAQRVADLARRLGANPEVHPGSRGTIDQGYTSQEGSTKSKLRYFEPGSETEQVQAVARMQNQRNERIRRLNQDQSKFGF